MITLTRLVVVAVLLVLGLGALAPTLTSHASSLRDSLPELSDTASGREQGQAQISPEEFGVAEYGTRKTVVRARVGEPERTTSADVEGVSLECWYYGVAGATGAYQLCFVEGRLSSKARFAPAG